MNNLKNKKFVGFQKREIHTIMELYSKKISIGEWKDYSISYNKEYAIFSIHRSIKQGSSFQIKKINSLHFNIKKFLEFLENQLDFTCPYPFNQIYLWLEKETCEETIEYIVSMMMEPFDEIVQPLIKNMSSDEERYFRIPTERTVLELKNILKQRYPDILKIDFEDDKLYIFRNSAIFSRYLSSKIFSKII